MANLYFLYCLVLLLLIDFGKTAGGFIKHRIAKRMDLESCIVRFDVHENTIIRTEESRAIGAKFLDNADLGSREECLRLCCETEFCDVFVFEEKSQGTCFLFQCGPPQNFRCKFTRHSNYSSAVLTPMVQVVAPITPPPEIPSSTPIIRLSQHELELANLREGKLQRKPAVMEATSTPTPITTTSSISPDIRGLSTTTVSNKLDASATQCSRFQFACHSGDCIAVYNACDGIPQCEDGSDEGPECPANSATKIPPLGPLGVAPIPKQSSNENFVGRIRPPALQQEELPNQELMAPSANIQVSVLKPIQLQQQIQNVQQQQQQLQQLRSGNSIGYAPNQQSSSRNREDAVLQPQWSLHQSSRPGQYSESDSHIFNHKGGLQIPTNNNAPSQYTNSMHDNYNNAPASRDNFMMTGQDPYRVGSMNLNLNQNQWIPTDHQWPIQQQIISQPDNIMENAIRDTQDLSVSQQMQQQVQRLQQRPEWPVRAILPVINNDDQILQTAKLAEAQKTNSPVKTIASSSASDESVGDEADYEEEDIRATEAPKKKTKKHKTKSKDIDDIIIPKIPQAIEKHNNMQPVHEQLRMIKSDLEIEFVDHDGPSERPGGAVLSLTLGIIVSAALAVLVGCRMRSVGRRVRRNGKSPYAHDADFLVNGMYL